MSRFETLVKRALEMQRASAHAMSVTGPGKAISSMINKLYEIGIPDNLNTLALRMIRTLQRVSRLQVTFSPPTLPNILFQEPAYPEAELEGAYPSIEEPQQFVVTSRFDPVTSIIRRMVRSFLRRPRRPERGREPEPPSMKMEVVYTIPEYKQKIVAAIPPLTYVPPELRPRPEIEKPVIRAETRLEEISVPKMVGVPERLYEIVEQYEVPDKKVLLMPRVEPPRAITPSLRVTPSIRRVRQTFQDLANWASGMSATQPVVTKIGLVDNYVDMQASIHDVVSQQAEVRKLRPTYDWRPLILEATKIASEQVFTRGRGEREAGRPGIFRGPQIDSVVEVLEGLVEDELPPLVTDVLTREAESKAALVSSEVERVTRQLAEEAAETYRQALTQLMPVHQRAAVKELVYAPGLKELVTKKLRTSLEIIGISEALSEEVRERELESGKVHPLQEYLTRVARLAGITRPEVPTYPVVEEDMVPATSPFHPLQEYITRALRLAGITRPGVPAYPIGEEDVVPVTSPFHPLQEYISRVVRLVGVTRPEVPTYPVVEEDMVPATSPFHPLQEFISRVVRLAGVTRPEVPTYPFGEEDMVPATSPFHPLHEYITKVARLAGITQVELPTLMEEIMVPTPTPLRPLQDYIDITAKLAKVAKLEEPIISIEEEVEEIARAPRHPIKAYVDLASRLGEFMSASSATVYGITAAHVPEIEYLGEGLDVFKTFDYVTVLKEIVTSKVEAEKVLTASLSGAVSSLLEVPLEEQAPEVVGLELPVSVPSPRLLDMVSVLSRTEALPRAQRPPSVRRERVVERRRPIDIKVEPKIGDIDLKELERKIARILREEARRYGVY
jgi:hypothetical protein